MCLTYDIEYLKNTKLYYLKKKLIKVKHINFKIIRKLLTSVCLEREVMEAYAEVNSKGIYPT